MIPTAAPIIEKTIFLAIVFEFISQAKFLLDLLVHQRRFFWA
jgi:hypothetical protein